MNWSGTKNQDHMLRPSQADLSWPKVNQLCFIVKAELESEFSILLSLFLYNTTP